MNNKAALFNHFDRVEIIHLKSRTDRYDQLERELHHVGVDIADATNVHIPDAPIVSDSYGFASKPVYGNFLSHLDILERARDDRVDSVLILEDDAIFSNRLVRPGFQAELVDELSSLEWDILYLGHPRIDSADGRQGRFQYTDKAFKWAHCYAVSGNCLDELVEYLRSTIDRPQGHPEGGKMYIDGALSHFRKLRSDVRTLICSPTLSIQRGSPSGIATRKRYDNYSSLSKPLKALRGLRDNLWKSSDIYIGRM